MYVYIYVYMFIYKYVYHPLRYTPSPPAVPHPSPGYRRMSLSELTKFEIPFSLVVSGMAQMHGFALWFDCRFPGSQRHIELSTAPHDPLTHWYQVRCIYIYIYIYIDR